jgi:hypothetical protein
MRAHRSYLASDACRNQIDRTTVAYLQDLSFLCDDDSESDPGGRGPTRPSYKDRIVHCAFTWLRALAEKAA